MQVRHLLVAASVALSALHASSFAIAQAAPTASMDTAQLARIQLDNAERAYREGRYREAATAFLAADRLQPTAAVQLALGKTYEQLSDPSRALAAYREYFVRSPRAADRAQVQERVAELAARLAEHGVQQISVSSIPAGATIVVDGKALGTTPIYVDLPPGAHHLEFHLQHYESAALDFQLSPQQPLNVMTTLVAARPGAQANTIPAIAPRVQHASKPATVAATPPAVATAAAPATAVQPVAESQPDPAPAEELSAPSPDLAASVRAPRPQPRDETTRFLRTFGFAAVGSGVAALGTAVAFELLRSQSESRARQTKQQVAFKEAFDRMESQQTIARAFAITAGVLAATGGVLLVLSTERDETPPPSEGVALACVPGACSATYQGRF